MRHNSGISCSTSNQEDKQIQEILKILHFQTIALLYYIYY